MQGPNSAPLMSSLTTLPAAATGSGMSTGSQLM
jgi:hypothetical protein